MSEPWPVLDVRAWRDTRETLHRYAQIIGKVQLASTPRVSHFWNVALRLTARGLATSVLRYDDRTFEMELDFVGSVLTIRSSDGEERELALRDRTVADFDRDVMAELAALGIRVPIWHQPVELASEPIPFREDRVHHAYDADWARRFWRVLLDTEGLMNEFRSRFVGKTSPVGFYWGTFDLCSARYSGLRAPEPPKGTIEEEAFSHEVSEVGFWPGDARYDQPAFFALHAPAPDGYAKARVSPEASAWAPDVRCFLLPYEAVRTASSPRDTLLGFFESTYAAGATLAHWNRADLERP